MNRLKFSKKWRLAALGLPFAVWAADEGPVTFDSRVMAGESMVLTGSVVTLGSGMALPPGAGLVVRASDSVVFLPGIDFAGGTLDLHVGPEPLAKPTALAVPVEAFAASVRRTSDGFVIRYELPEAGRLNLRVLDAQGKTVFRTSLHTHSAGRYEKVLSFTPNYSGLYLVRTEFAGEVVLQRVFFGQR